MLGVVCGFGAAAGAFILITRLNAYRPIPKSINSQISFSIYYPKKGAPIAVDTQTVKYDTSNKFLSFVAKDNKSQSSITISEQATPDTFADPQVDLYPKELDKLNQYSDLTTPIGKVTLTLPKEYKGGQAAVLNNEGTLLFARPSSNLTNGQWQQFFNQFIKL